MYVYLADLGWNICRSIYVYIQFNAEFFRNFGMKYRKKITNLGILCKHCRGGSSQGALGARAPPLRPSTCPYVVCSMLEAP